MGWFSKLLGIVPTKQPVHVTDENFKREVMKSDVPVVLDIWGSKCAPCKQLEPVMMELAAAYDGKVKVCEMNAETAPKACFELKVRATPTVIYFRHGREVERTSGFRSSVYHHESVQELFEVPAPA